MAQQKPSTGTANNIYGFFALRVTGWNKLLNVQLKDRTPADVIRKKTMLTYVISVVRDTNGNGRARCLRDNSK